MGARVSHNPVAAVLGISATRLAVQEHNVLLDGLAADVQLIGREVWVGVADRQTAQN